MHVYANASHTYLPACLSARSLTCLPIIPPVSASVSLLCTSKSPAASLLCTSQSPDASLLCTSQPPTASLLCMSQPPDASLQITSAQSDDYSDIPNSQIRRITAKRLLESKQTVPHYYLTIDCRVDKLVQLRQQLNASLAKDGKKLSVNDFVIKASAQVRILVPPVDFCSGTALFSITPQQARRSTSMALSVSQFLYICHYSICHLLSPSFMKVVSDMNTCAYVLSFDYTAVCFIYHLQFLLWTST